MISLKKCLGCPPFLGYICWRKVVGSLLFLSAPLALLSFRLAWQQECNFGGEGSRKHILLAKSKGGLGAVEGKSVSYLIKFPTLSIYNIWKRGCIVVSED